LTWDHRDPFDRLLFAQAMRSNPTIVTRDATIIRFLAHAIVA